MDEFNVQRTKINKSVRMENKNIVLFGGNSFVGSAIEKRLDNCGMSVSTFSRNDADFTDLDQVKRMVNDVEEGGVLVLVAAKSPAKNFGDIEENIRLISNLCVVLTSKNPNYVLNISSDAVYADSVQALTEKSLQAPLNPHGVMHSMREMIVNNTFNCTVGHLRPTLIFGDGDPHNGYGPNRFKRNMAVGDPITLFGQGEERRDHIHIDDVALIAGEMIMARQKGPVNAVTGKVRSFMEIAEAACFSDDQVQNIVTTRRQGTMPHNGYRAFDNMLAKKLCSNAEFRDVLDYLKNK